MNGYNNQPPQNQQWNNNGPRQAPNPNGGYAKPSQFGAGRETAILTVTPEMLSTIALTNKFRIEIYETKTNQYGPSRRVIVKEYKPRQQQAQRPQGNWQQPAQNQGQPQQQNNWQQQQQPAQQQSQPQQDPRPLPPIDDDIMF